MALLHDCRNRVGVNGARAFRVLVALAVLVVGGVLAASALATGRSETNLRALNHQVFAAVNRFRAAHGLGRLRDSTGLDRSARQHSLEMGRLGYFAHNSANGAQFWQRIQHYYPRSGGGSWLVGENLLWASPRVSAGQAMSMWIASPEHLRNLMDPRWRQFGVSAVRVAHAPGVYQGLRVTIITTDFGARG